jgi:hypothetical protein
VSAVDNGVAGIGKAAEEELGLPGRHHLVMGACDDQGWNSDGGEFAAQVGDGVEPHLLRDPFREGAGVDQGLEFCVAAASQERVAIGRPGNKFAQEILIGFEEPLPDPIAEPLLGVGPNPARHQSQAGHASGACSGQVCRDQGAQGVPDDMDRPYGGAMIDNSGDLLGQCPEGQLPLGSLEIHGQNAVPGGEHGEQGAEMGLGASAGAVHQDHRFPEVLRSTRVVEWDRQGPDMGMTLVCIWMNLQFQSLQV